MELLSWRGLVLRFLVMPSLFVAVRLQSWSMTLTAFAHGLMFYMGAMNHGGMQETQNLAVRNGAVTMTAQDHATIRQHVLEEIALELSEERKPKVFH